MAKTYHEAYPEKTIRVFDSASSVGGVWAAERLYPGLKTNNVVGSYEFSDFPMIPARYGFKDGQHIPGMAVHRYLCDAVEHFDISRYLRFEIKVDSASRNDDRSWMITYFPLAPGSSSVNPQRVIAEKLVVATGLTSEPFLPYIKGQEQFKGLILHSRRLKDSATRLATAENVVVIGGNKSAWDVCYSVAQSGRTAHMVLRPSGGGPSWVWPLILKPFKTSLSILSRTRLLTLFDPWPFDRSRFLRRMRRFLHSWLIGRWITTQFWNVLGGCIRKQNGYDESYNCKKLAPWYSVYWMGNSLGVHNYETSWFELACNNKIKIHIADVEYVEERSVKLSNGEIDNVDALVCCTGWKAEPPLKFAPAEVLNTMGIPGSMPLSPELSGKARDCILHQRPMLRAGPLRQSVEPLASPDNATKSGQFGPYRLYRYLVPANADFMADRNIAFLGTHLSVHAIMLAQVQALWITAFFENNISSLRPETIDQKQVELDTALHVEYQKLRRPRGAGGHGAGFPDLVFDSLPYVDILMDDIGLRIRRKSNVFADLFKPYSLRDYRDLVVEWKRSQACK